MDQKTIDLKKWDVRLRKSELEKQLRELDADYKQLSALESKLDDPHALIPNGYKSLTEWLEGHPFPDGCKSMTFKNRREAEEVKICCNTYNFDYQIVKCDETEAGYYYARIGKGIL